MTEPRKVCGLFDVIEAEAHGASWVAAPASKDATIRLADLQQILDELIVATSEKRSRGQPPKTRLQHNDVKRAFLLYCTALEIRSQQRLSRGADLKLSVHDLIAEAQEKYPSHGLWSKPKETNKMYASLKGGREELGIDSAWSGPEIESLFNRE